MIIVIDGVIIWRKPSRNCWQHQEHDIFFQVKESWHHALTASRKNVHFLSLFIQKLFIEILIFSTMFEDDLLKTRQLVEFFLAFDILLLFP